jgi:hypothetical protein
MMGHVVAMLLLIAPVSTAYVPQMFGQVLRVIAGS